MTGNTHPDARCDEAQLALFEASRARLFSLAYRILGVRADAEDVVQDTFVKWHVHQRSENGAPDNPLDTPAAWLATVARRTAIDRLRRLKHEAPFSVDEENLESIDDEFSALNVVEQALDLSRGMRLMLDRLSAEEQTAFLLREAFEADYASIAKVLNRSAAHCRQIVHRAKERVRVERKQGDASRGVQETHVIEPLLDAIARQDVNALVALTLTTVAASGLKAVSAAMAEQHAAVVTRALITRLRRGRIHLPTSVADEQTACVATA